MTQTDDRTDGKAAPAQSPWEDVTCVVFRHGKKTLSPTSLADISEILEEPGCLVWFDVVDPGPHDLALLQEEFNLHPLAVEDAVVAHQRPKVETYENYWFLVIHGVILHPEGLSFHEMAIFAGKNFLVSVRHSPSYSLKEVEKRWSAHPEELRRGAGFLLYTILDIVVDGYVPVSERFQERVDDLEEALFDTNAMSQNVLPEIFGMKKDAQQFRRVVLPMRELLTPLTRQDVPLFDQDESLYFRDVYDHTILVIDQLDSMRDLINSALEIHLSVVANRQNEVAKQLTTIATIFLPLSFVVGFFGQNFAWMVNHIVGAGTFWFLGIGTEILVVALTVLFFKVRGWF